MRKDHVHVKAQATDGVVILAQFAIVVEIHFRAAGRSGALDERLNVEGPARVG